MLSGFIEPSFRRGIIVLDSTQEKKKEGITASSPPASSSSLPDPSARPARTLKTQGDFTRENDFLNRAQAHGASLARVSRARILIL
jgi:hypothetical protein